MKRVLYFALFSLALASCASSQTAMSREARKKVDYWKPILKLTPDQESKMYHVEREFLSEESRIRNSGNDEKKIKNIKEKRVDDVKKILDYDQFLKFDAIEHKRLKKVPLRV